MIGPGHRGPMDAPADDSKHALLSKAVPPAQTYLDPVAGVPLLEPPLRFGSLEVKEVDVRSALTRCALPGEPWSLNPYMGCSHGCGYCYVPDVAHVERARWGTYVVAKRNLPAVLARELRRRQRRPVFLSSATDPYQSAEGRFRITRKCLAVLAAADWPLTVLTRSPLVTRDRAVLSSFSKVSVGLSVPTLDERLRRAVEPGAPSVYARLAALRRLADAGLPTFVNAIPLYPWTPRSTPEAMAAAFAQAGAGRVYAGPWRYRPTTRAVISSLLAPRAGDAFLDAFGGRFYFRRAARALGHAGRRHGLDVRVRDDAAGGR